MSDRHLAFWPKTQPRHLSLPKELMGTFAYRMAMAWQRTDNPDEVKPWFLRDSPGFAITPELAPRASEAIFDKLTMSALEGTPLAIALRDCNINAVALVGVAMEIGIEPTARHAADLGIIPVIVQDACGAGHAEAAERSIESLKFAGDAIITDSDRWATVQIALRGLTSRVEESNVPVAGAVIAAIPIVIVLILFQRHIVRGLTAGAVKG